MDAPRTGILLIIAGSLVFGVLDTLAKYLSQDYDVLQITWGRYVFHLLLVALLFPRRNLLALMKTNRPGLQIVRAALLLGATLTFFLAISFIPLADAVAIASAAPLVATALAIPLLGERVGPRRWSAVVIGLAGVFIIIRPGVEIRHWGYFLPLLVAGFYALYQIATRALSRTDPAVTTWIFTALVGAVVMSAVTPFVWRTPVGVDWALFAGLGLCGGLGHLLVIKAFQKAPVSMLAPYAYAEIPWIALLGYLVFGDFPDALTILGTIIIFTSGLYVFYRESAARPGVRAA